MFHPEKTIMVNAMGSAHSVPLKKTSIFVRTDEMFPCWCILSLKRSEYGVCSCFIQLSSALSLWFFFLISCFDSLERISTGVIVTFSIE